MAQFVITIPDDKVTAVVNAFAKQYSYQDMIEQGGVQIPNPETKPKFAKRMILQFIKEVYIAAQTKTIDEQRPVVIVTATEEVQNIAVD